MRVALFAAHAKSAAVDPDDQWSVLTLDRQVEIELLQFVAALHIGQITQGDCSSERLSCCGVLGYHVL